MLTIKIPGREEMVINHLILDYNGTIALDGHILEEIMPRLEVLSRDLSIYVITADTHGTAAQRCSGLPLEVKTFPTTQVGQIKADEAAKLSGGVACIGNGFNDIPMSDVCDLSICVIGREGCCGALLAHVDVVVTSIADALDLLLKSGCGGEADAGADELVERDGHLLAVELLLHVEEVQFRDGDWGALCADGGGFADIDDAAGMLPFPLGGGRIDTVGREKLAWLADVGGGAS